MMNRLEPPAGRDRENPDPRELNRPIPKIFIALIVLLLAWAIYYIAKQAPGLESSSAPRPGQPVAAAPARAG